MSTYDWGDVEFSVDDLGPFPPDAGRRMGERASEVAERLKGVCSSALTFHWRREGNATAGQWWLPGLGWETPSPSGRTSLVGLLSQVAPWFERDALWQGYCERQVICGYDLRGLTSGRRSGKSEALAAFARLLDLPLMAPHRVEILAHDLVRLRPVQRAMLEDVRTARSVALGRTMHELFERDGIGRALVADRARQPRVDGDVRSTCALCGRPTANPFYRTCDACGERE